MIRGNENFSIFGALFQTKIIHALLVDQVFFEKIFDILLSEYFDQKPQRHIYEVILEYFDKYKTIPTVDVVEIACKTIEDEILRDECQKVIYEIKKNIVSDLTYIKDKTLEFCRNQKMVKALRMSIDYLQEGNMESIWRVIKDAMNAGEGSDIGHNYFEHFDKRLLMMNRSAIPTGWKILDKILNGGLGKGELSVILAGTSIGKSWMLSYIGKGALENGKIVAHYTFELYEHNVGSRYDAIISNVPINLIQEREDLVRRKLREFAEEHKAKLIIKNYPTKTANVNKIRNHLNKLSHYNIVPDLVIVDYADLMTSRKNYDQKRHELESIYEDLRAMAGELQVPIVTACFHGDTEIKLVDGRNIKIRDAVNLSKTEQLYVYSWDLENSKLVMGKVNSVFKTGNNQKLFKLTLDNDKFVITTENHKFMLRNGEYKQLKDLKVGDSLMPFNDKINSDNRKLIYDNNGKFIENYRFVAENKYGEIPKFHQIHHIDHDKTNDHPDNLKMMTISEHYREHSWFNQGTLADNEYFEKTKNIPLRSGDKKHIWAHKNHKIKSIEFFGYDDVYNMEVDKYHNYALSCGIIVKNSQTNRGGMDEEIVTLSSIGESFAKAQVADVIISLSRSYEDKRMNRGKVFIAKNRAGQDGLICPVIMNTTTAQMEILEPEQTDPRKEFADETAAKEAAIKLYQELTKKKKNNNEQT